MRSRKTFMTRAPAYLDHCSPTSCRATTRPKPREACLASTGTVANIVTIDRSGPRENLVAQMYRVLDASIFRSTAMDGVPDSRLHVATRARATGTVARMFELKHWTRFGPSRGKNGAKAGRRSEPTCFAISNDCEDLIGLV